MVLRIRRLANEFSGLAGGIQKNQSRFLSTLGLKLPSISKRNMLYSQEVSNEETTDKVTQKKNEKREEFHPGCYYLISFPESLFFYIAFIWWNRVLLVSLPLSFCMMVPWRGVKHFFLYFSLSLSYLAYQKVSTQDGRNLPKRRNNWVDFHIMKLVDTLLELFQRSRLKVFSRKMGL